MACAHWHDAGASRRNTTVRSKTSGKVRWLLYHKAPIVGRSSVVFIVHESTSARSTICVRPALWPPRVTWSHTRLMHALLDRRLSAFDLQPLAPKLCMWCEDSKALAHILTWKFPQALEACCCWEISLQTAKKPNTLKV